MKLATLQSRVVPACCSTRAAKLCAKPGAIRNHRTSKSICRAESPVNDADTTDLEDKVESFMKKQAEIESGAAFARTVDPDRVIGADEVDEEAAKGMAREIFEVLKRLKSSRDMSVNEVKLIISIDDPRNKEQRALGIEDNRGVSRDEMALALTQISEGKLPKDRIALRCLFDEITNWPFLDSAPPASSSSSSSPSSAAGSAEPRQAPSPSEARSLSEGSDSIVKPYVMGQAAREGDKPRELADMLPDWVGYVTLYGVSAIPVLLVVATVLILFYNSLK